VAAALYARGAVLVLSARRQDELERVRDACVAGAFPRDRPRPPVPAVLVVDLERTETLAGAAAAAATLLGGAVQVLINNGGIGVRAAALETQLAVERRVMAVNFTACCELTRAVLPAMVDAGEGHIVVVSSVQGRVALPDRSAYSASKHALHGYFNALRCEVAPLGVRVVLVLPGYVATSLSLNALRADGTAYNRMDETTRRGYPPARVAECIATGVARGRREVWIMQLSGRLAIYIGFFAPALLEWYLGATRRAHAS
jgi:dehydrogenase/reductase SDR family member 7B